MIAGDFEDSPATREYSVGASETVLRGYEPGGHQPKPLP